MGFLLVFIGSGLGGMARYGMGLISSQWLGGASPIGTLTVNIVGSALMGAVIALFARLGADAQDARLFLTTGLIGGFTTFSAFSWEAAGLWERGDRLGAALYVSASVALSVAARASMIWLVRRFT